MNKTGARHAGATLRRSSGGARAPPAARACVAQLLLAAIVHTSMALPRGNGGALARAQGERPLATHAPGMAIDWRGEKGGAPAGDGARRSGKSVKIAGVFPAATVATSAFLWGYETGIITAALLSIVPAFGLDAQPGALGLVAATATVGSLCGTLTAGRCADFAGRRKMLQTAASCSIVGCVLASNAARLDVLIFARLLAGVSIGIFATVTPMYAAECAETATRGTVMSLPQLGMSSGIASAYLASILMLQWGGSHKHMFASVSAPGVLCLLVASVSPESPRWLLLQGDHDGAMAALARLRGADACHVAHEVQQVATGIREEAASSRAHWHSLSERSVLRTLGLCLLLQVFQQLSGINAVINFGPAIMREAGVAALFRNISRGNDKASLMMATFAVYSPKLIMISLVVPLMDWLGRRFVLLAFLPVLAGSLLSLALALDARVPAVGPSTALIALLIYQSAFSCSLGPIPSMLSAELLPNHARAAGMSVLLSICTLCNVGVSSSWPLLQALFGSSKILMIYAGMTTLAFVFTYLFVPETAQIALEATRL